MDNDDLPADHPCAFANPFLSDPLVEAFVTLYDTAWQTKDECVKSQDYEFALTIYHFQETLRAHARAYCDNLPKGD
jgi:hypothetical protein